MSGNFREKLDRNNFRHSKFRGDSSLGPTKIPHYRYNRFTAFMQELMRME